jgi:hypothetical protein
MDFLLHLGDMMGSSKQTPWEPSRNAIRAAYIRAVAAKCAEFEFRRPGGAFCDSGGCFGHHGYVAMLLRRIPRLLQRTTVGEFRWRY